MKLTYDLSNRRVYVMYRGHIFDTDVVVWGVIALIFLWVFLVASYSPAD